MKSEDRGRPGRMGIGSEKAKVTGRHRGKGGVGSGQVGKARSRKRIANTKVISAMKR